MISDGVQAASVELPDENEQSEGLRRKHRKSAGSMEFDVPFLTPLKTSDFTANEIVETYKAPHIGVLEAFERESPIQEFICEAKDDPAPSSIGEESLATSTEFATVERSMSSNASASTDLYSEFGSKYSSQHASTDDEKLLLSKFKIPAGGGETGLSTPGSVGKRRGRHRQMDYFWERQGPDSKLSHTSTPLIEPWHHAAASLAPTTSLASPLRPIHVSEYSVGPFLGASPRTPLSPVSNEPVANGKIEAFYPRGDDSERVANVSDMMAKDEFELPLSMQLPVRPKPEADDAAAGVAEEDIEERSVESTIGNRLNSNFK